MKTLKQLKQESIEFYTANAATYFAASFNKKMAGTQVIRFEGDFLPQVKIDKREYYSGRGAKYNTCSMHEHIDVCILRSVFDEKVNSRAKMLFERQKENIRANKQIKYFCKVHKLNASNYNGSGISGLYFSFSKKSEIEKELGIDLTEFFNATGKTYFFAESKIGLLLFYHNHRQSYSFSIVTEEKRAEFSSNRKSWVSAPYAGVLGQTENIDLYVC
jgi:hypothetical protein